MSEKNEIVIFETEDKEVKLPVTVEDETVWLNQNQMIELFGRDQSVISRHIRNVFKEHEVDEKRGCEITVSTEKEDFSFKMNERSSFMLKLTCDENFNYKL